MFTTIWIIVVTVILLAVDVFLEKDPSNDFSPVKLKCFRETPSGSNSSYFTGCNETDLQLRNYSSHFNQSTPNGCVISVTVTANNLDLIYDISNITFEKVPCGNKNVTNMTEYCFIYQKKNLTSVTSRMRGKCNKNCPLTLARSNSTKQKKKCCKTFHHTCFVPTNISNIEALKKKLEDITTENSDILEFVKSWEKFRSKDVNASEMNQIWQSLGRKITKFNSKQPNRFVHTNSTAFGILKFKPSVFLGYTFPNKSTKMSSESSLSFAYNTIPLSRNRSFIITSASYQPLKEMVENAKTRNASTISGNIIFTSIFPQVINCVRLIFKIPRDQSFSECVFWDDILSSWTNEGCEGVNYSTSHVECECNQFGAFAALFTKKNEDINKAKRLLEKSISDIQPTKGSVLKFMNEWENIRIKNDTGMLKMLEDLCENLSDKLGPPEYDTKDFLVSHRNSTLLISNINTSRFRGYSFNMSSNLLNESSNHLSNLAIRLPNNIFNFTGKTNKCYSTIISMSTEPSNKMKFEAEKRNASIAASNIISTSIKPRLLKNLEHSNGVQITFIITPNQSLKFECVFWNYSLDSWSNEGCYLVPSNDRYVECECNHLTEFSILMSVVDVKSEEEEILHYIKLIGCIISIIFLIMAVFVILFFQKLRKNHRFMIHLNLAASLIVGNVSMLFTDAAKNSNASCMTVSILMFYFYLAAFFWMLCEGVFIWRAFVTVFAETGKFWKYLLLGWGCPLIVIVTTASVRHDRLISDKACWLSLEDHTIYGFVAPVLLIIAVDSVIMVVALVVTLKQSKRTNKSDVKTMVKATLMLLPLLGVTWFFGVLVVNKETIVFKYVFAALNSLQGFFLFLFYVVGSKEVHKQFRSIYRVHSAKRFNSSKSTGSSQGAFPMEKQLIGSKSHV